MFKLPILQHLFNISDDELEYQVNDRQSFMKFLGLGIEDRIPDAKTVWLFRQQLTEHGLILEFFETFENHLRESGYEAQKGQIVDVTLVPVPKQRNRRKENQKIRDGEVPEEWLGNPRKLYQKDIDARWTKKNSETHYGYKSHISIDRKFAFVRRCAVTEAAVHDSQVLGQIFDIQNSDDEVWGDSAYRSEETEWILETLKFKSEIHERVYKNRPLTEEQKETNRKKSKIRAKVEHIFEAWVTNMGGKLVRSIGRVRVEANIGLKNLAYNIKRFVFLENQVGVQAEIVA
jgi:IS5 family transposase